MLMAIRMTGEDRDRLRILANERGITLAELVLKSVFNEKAAGSQPADVGREKPKGMVMQSPKNPRGRRGSPTKNEASVDRRGVEPDDPARPKSESRKVDETPKGGGSHGLPDVPLQCMCMPVEEHVGVGGHRATSVTSGVVSYQPPIESPDLKAQPWLAQDIETRRHLHQFNTSKGHEPTSIVEWNYFFK